MLPMKGGFWLTLATTLCAASCLSPTLPLPPPEVDNISETEAGTWQVRGTCAPGAEVVILDDATGRGVVVEDRERRGIFFAVVQADPCDLIIVTQSVGGEDSAASRFVVQELREGTEVDPQACAP